MRGRNGTIHRYYYCANHDPLRARGEHRRCPERNVRADELDAFVFAQVRAALLCPQTLLAGQAAMAAQRKPTGDELLTTELTRLDRKIEAVSAERRRVADLYQAGFIEQHELLRRGKELDLRRRTLEVQRDTLICERKELAQKNRLRQRVSGFAEKITAKIDRLNFEQRQKLLRLIVERVHVKGYQVEVTLRIPLDDPPDPSGERVSSKDRLRSLDAPGRQQLPPQGGSGARRTPRRQEGALKRASLGHEAQRSTPGVFADGPLR
jgi:site-specific DNA recombinase